MAIRCSIFGHTWADPEVEREREERGTEVVVTAREIRTCTRCKKAELLSESTEVTAAEHAASHADDETASSDSGRQDSDTALTEDPAEVVDDGIILTDDDEPGKWSTEWPDPGLHQAEEPESEPRPWPDAEPPDPVVRDRAVDDVFRPTEPVASGSEGTGKPVDPADVLSEAAAEQRAVSDPGRQDGVTSDRRDDHDPGLRDDANVEKVDEELPLEDLVVFCPNCSFVDERPKPSLRGGDSCPACRTRYLEERER